MSYNLEEHLHIWLDTFITDHTEMQNIRPFVFYRIETEVNEFTARSLTTESPIRIRTGLKSI